MTSKKIEPTGVMVDEAANVLRLDATHESLRFHAGMAEHTYHQRAQTVMRAALRAALNHPDAAELLASEWKANAEAAAERAERAEEKLADSVHVDEDDRPWEPLGQDDPLHAGDEVRREWRGVSTRGIVDVQRFDSQVYTAERGHLGHQGIGTWYVRRTVQDLPTAAWYANEAVLGPDHPAVKALVGALGFEDTPAQALTDAIHNLTADDLRNLPEGRKLMAEVWQEGAMGHAGATSRMTPETRRIINELMRAANPYLETPNE